MNSHCQPFRPPALIVIRPAASGAANTTLTTFASVTAVKGLVVLHSTAADKQQMINACMVVDVYKMLTTAMSKKLQKAVIYAAERLRTVSWPFQQDAMCACACACSAAAGKLCANSC
jgi:hypothetical protein